MLRLAAAWMAAVVASSVTAMFIVGKAPISSFTDGILGIGLILGMPMLLFSLLIAFPLRIVTNGIASAVVRALVAGAISAFIASVLAGLVFPTEWQGATQACIIFAAFFGLFYGFLYRLPATGFPLSRE